VLTFRTTGKRLAFRLAPIPYRTGCSVRLAVLAVVLVLVSLLSSLDLAYCLFALRQAFRFRLCRYSVFKVLYVYSFIIEQKKLLINLITYYHSSPHPPPQQRYVKQ
jgi:hypothetical protein